VQNRTLNHALETERRLGVDFLAAGNNRRVLIDEVSKALAQFVHIDGAGTQHFGCCRVVEHGQQQVLDSNELMALLPRVHECHV